jgi:hypothetical protein
MRDGCRPILDSFENDSQSVQATSSGRFIDRFHGTYSPNINEGIHLKGPWSDMELVRKFLNEVLKETKK